MWYINVKSSCGHISLIISTGKGRRLWVACCTVRGSVDQRGPLHSSLDRKRFGRQQPKGTNWWKSFEGICFNASLNSELPFWASSRVTVDKKKPLAYLIHPAPRKIFTLANTVFSTLLWWDSSYEILCETHKINVFVFCSFCIDRKIWFCCRCIG